MNKERVFELININSKAYPGPLHLVLIETLIDAGNEILSEIVSEQGFDKEKATVLQILNISLGWNSLFAGLREDSLAINPQLLNKCLESVEGLDRVLDYVRDNCQNDDKELENIKFIKEKLAEGKENLNQAKFLSKIGEDDDSKFEIIQESFHANRRMMLAALQKIMGYELSKRYGDEMNKVGTWIMEYQKKAEDKMKTGE